jgi:hypothetical protein
MSSPPLASLAHVSIHCSPLWSPFSDCPVGTAAESSVLVQPQLMVKESQELLAFVIWAQRGQVSGPKSHSLGAQASERMALTSVPPLGL